MVVKVSKPLFEDYPQEKCDVVIITQDALVYTTSMFLSFVSTTLRDLLKVQQTTQSFDTNSSSDETETTTLRENVPSKQSRFLKRFVRTTVDEVTAPDSPFVNFAGSFACTSPSRSSNQSNNQPLYAPISILVEDISSANVQIVLTFYNPRHYSHACITGKAASKLSSSCSY